MRRLEVKRELHSCAPGMQRQVGSTQRHGLPEPTVSARPDNGPHQGTSSAPDESQSDSLIPSAKAHKPVGRIITLSKSDDHSSRPPDEETSEGASTGIRSPPP